MDMTVVEMTKEHYKSSGVTMNIFSKCFNSKLKSWDTDMEYRCTLLITLIRTQENGQLDEFMEKLKEHKRYANPDDALKNSSMELIEKTFNEVQNSSQNVMSFNYNKKKRSISWKNDYNKKKNKKRKWYNKKSTKQYF